MTLSVPVPGTVQLVDTKGTLNVKHGKDHHDIVLVPQPSDHPDDPLRWTQPRKMQNVACAMAWCFFAAAMISGLSPAYVLMEADTGISVADLSTGNGLMFLFLGCGTLITQCAALNYGRRPTLVASIILTTLVSLWAAYVKTKGEFFANRIILGVVSSPMETLIEVIIGDVFFTHDRGFYMGLYSWTLWGAAFLAPVASGFVAQDLGWRWIQYIMAIIGAGTTAMTFFFFEETMYYRPAGQPEIMGANSDDTKYSSSSPDQASFARSIDNNTAEPPLESTKTRLEKMRLWGLRDPRQPNPFKLFFLPIQLYRYPGMIFSGILVGGILSWYNVVGGSLALILSNAPYNFTANTIGLTYLACFIGVSIGCFISGWLSDIIVIKLARRNGGVMEPEQRLWLCLVAIVAHPAGCLLYGVGASYSIHWVGIIFGLGLISVTLPIGTSLAFTYILDSYKEVAGEGMVSVILIRNLMGFAFSYAVVPIINNLGLRNAFVLVALLGLMFWCFCIFMIVFGKSLRRSSATSYWRLVEKYGAAAH
ncbi:major facilitator superfamily domain-containing protein [Dactylonectria macrodidyma]|uniref:Major facilitator superfamily domain-containing protein n=1 Tax=Dactylonectria macrodidyma TaxID=307937 RepID=A0A9P9ESJ4_9HYPO|nr:major facilitator superfamily domain-containing protein [Dactylonectria macrodidyma]